MRSIACWKNLVQRFRILGKREVDVQGEDAVRPEAGVDAAHAQETLEQQAGAAQQHHGERHLENHQQAAQALARTPVGGAASRFLERFV